MSPSISFNVLLQCGLLLLCANCVRLENYEHGYLKGRAINLSRSYSWWPSIHNGAVLRSRRQAAPAGIVGETEGGEVQSKVEPTQPPVPTTVSTSTVIPAMPVAEQNKTGAKDEQSDPLKPSASKGNEANVVSTTPATVVNNDDKKVNATITDKSTASEIDFNNPGVLKRGFIVFGGFTLLAVAYFIFYRTKSKKNDSSNTHSTIDANQFRYGVLKSDDQRDNLELSRVPLTMESDDDEDEDLEIFDLEQKKKSLSYVNLQMNDEDIVLSRSESRGNEIDNLLLDIEDGNSETLINWSSSGNKSIL